MAGRRKAGIMQHVQALETARGGFTVLGTGRYVGCVMHTMTYRMILLALAISAGDAATGLAENPASKKTRAAIDQRRVMFEAVDIDGDRAISKAEFFQAYSTKQLDSPKVAKQNEKGVLPAEDVSAGIFNLVDTDDDGAIDKSEVEKALVARVITYKYHYVPTPGEQEVLRAAREQAMKDDAIRKEMDAATALQKEAADHWDDASLQKKAGSAMARARKNLQKEMIAIDPLTKPIFELMADDEP